MGNDFYKKWWFWVGLILVIGIAATKNGVNEEQEAADALVSQIKQFESELGKVNEPENSVIKKFDTRYKAFIDSSKIYAKKESIKPESVSEIKNKLDKIRSTLDSLVSASLINRMLGSYKGSGQIATEIPNWGIVPSGAIMTEVIINKNGNMYYSRMSPDFRQNQASFKIIEIEEMKDSTLVGYFQNKANDVKFCSFKWSPSKLALEGNLWRSENKKQ